MKVKRFTCQQIHKQEKPIEGEDSSNSYEGKRLVGEKEINESHQFGNLLLKISKQEEAIFNLSEQLRSSLIQYEVLNEELDQLKTLLATNKKTQENKYDYSPSNHLVKQYQYRQKTLNTSSRFLKSISNKFLQLKMIKIKEFLKDQKKQKQSLLRDKNNKQSEKDADIVNKYGTQLENVKTLKTFKQEKKKTLIQNSRLQITREGIYKKKIFQCQNQERANQLTFLTKKVMEPCHVKLNETPQSG